MPAEQKQTQQPTTQLNALTYPLHGLRLIEASAGTGKTYTLAALYVRLVLGHGGENNFAAAPFLPPQILVVTFTKAATEELRGRIRERLVQSAAAFRGASEVAEQDEFLQQLLASYHPDDYETCAYRLQTAAEWMDESAIFTIHSWCQRMLSTYAFDSGVAFKEELVTDETSLIDQAVYDYWRIFFYPLKQPQGLVGLGAAARSPMELKSKISTWLYNNGQKITIHAQGEPLQASLTPEQALQQLIKWQEHAEVLKTRFQRALTLEAFNILEDYHHNKRFNGTRYRFATWQEKEQPLWQQLLKEPNLFDPLNSSQWALLAKYCHHRFQAGGVKKGEPAIEHAVFDVLDDVATFIEQQPDVEWQVLQHAGQWVNERLVWYKQQQAVMGYNDLLTRLHTALQREGGDILAAHIRQQFPMAMIDEFQDTDPLQFEIFQRVYPEPASKEYGLTLVGDPKQAIYKFRGADIYTYLAARELAGQQRYFLPTNYRSSQALVTAVNALFDRDPDFADGVFGMAKQVTNNPLPFEPVQAHGRPYQFATSLAYWLLTDNEHEQGFISRHQYEQQSAEQAAYQIVALLQGEKALQPQEAADGIVAEAAKAKTAISPADIAVLVPDFKRAQLVRDALSRCGVASVYLSERQSIFSTVEAQTLFTWLEAIWFCEQEQKVKAALLQGLTAISDREAEAWLSDDAAWEHTLGVVRNVRAIWRKQGVLPAVRKFLFEFALAEKWLAQPQGERQLTNVLHLAEVLQQESQRSDGELGLLRWFAQHINSPDGSEEHQQRLESDAERVQVVTYHKSKGLQYNFVFIPFVVSYRKAHRGDEVSYMASGQLIRDIKPDQNAVDQANRESLHEQTRLLYVALTRAVYGCWLGIGNILVGNAREPRLNDSALGRLLGMEQGDSTEHLLNLLSGLPWQQVPLLAATCYQAEPLQHVQTHALRPSVPVRREHWWVASYSALKLGAQVHFEETAQDTQLQDSFDEKQQGNALLDDVFLTGIEPAALGMHHFPRGAAAGNFLHGVLEWAWEQGFAALALAQQTEKISQNLQTQLARQGWSNFQPDVEQWLQHILQVPLQACGESLIALPETVAEMEFWLSAEQVQVAQLDRLIQRYFWPQKARPELLSSTLNGMLKGFIDLIFQDSKGRYWVMDYKSNWLGEQEQSYSQTAMQEAMLQHRYEVQASLYILALHRLLKARLPNYMDDPLRYLGGGIYWFVRAPEQGQIVLKPQLDFILALDALFAGEELAHA